MIHKCLLVKDILIKKFENIEMGCFESFLRLKGYLGRVNAKTIFE